MDVLEVNVKTKKKTTRAFSVGEKADCDRIKIEAAPTYADKRREEYPEIGEQLDAIMKWVAGENEIAVTPELKSIAMKCMSVKSKHPKPDRKDKK